MALQAYLMQHIMASRYIVAQQHQKAGGAAGGLDGAAGGAPTEAFHRTHTDE